MNKLYKIYLYLRQNAKAAIKAIFSYTIFQKIKVKQDTTIYPSSIVPVSFTWNIDAFDSLNISSNASNTFNYNINLDYNIPIDIDIQKNLSNILCYNISTFTFINFDAFNFSSKEPDVFNYTFTISGSLPFTVSDMILIPDTGELFSYNFTISGSMPFIIADSLSATSNEFGYIWSTNVDEFILKMQDCFGHYTWYSLEELTSFSITNSLSAIAYYFNYGDQIVNESNIYNIKEYNSITTNYIISDLVSSNYNTLVLSAISTYLNCLVAWDYNFLSIGELYITQQLPDYFSYSINTTYDNVYIDSTISQKDTDLLVYNFSNLITLDFTSTLGLIPCEHKSLEFVDIDIPTILNYSKINNNLAATFSINPSMSIPLWLDQSFTTLSYLPINYIDFSIASNEILDSVIQYPILELYNNTTTDFGLTFTSTLDLVPCERTSLEYVNIITDTDAIFNYKLSDKVASTICSNFIIEHFASPKVVMPSYTIDSLTVDVADTKLFSILSYIINGNNLNFNYSVNAASTQVNSHFIYCTFAKLIEYQSSVNTLGSMSSQTLAELSYHKHNY